ncbi:MAG: extracellular solute-binding protein [Janthinobacterium lividum]
MAHALCLATLPVGAAQAADLTVTAFGGSWEHAYRMCFVQPFEKETGKTVDVVLGSPLQWVNQVAANPTKPPIDVIVGTPEEAYEATSLGLLDKLTPAEVPNMKDLDPQLLDYGKGYGFPLTFGDFGLAYNAKTVKNPPKSWKEFVDGTVAGKWQVALPGIAYVATPPGLITLFTKIYGGSGTNIQPALDQVKRMAASGHAVFYSDPNTPLMSLRSGDVDMAMYYDGRAWAEHDANNPDLAFVTPAPGAVAFPNMAQKVRNGSPLGLRFLNTLASVEGQTCFSNAMQYAASNRNVRYDAKVAPRIAKKEGSLWIDFKDVQAHAPQWIEQWNKQIGR